MSPTPRRSLADAPTAHLLRAAAASALLVTAALVAGVPAVRPVRYKPVQEPIDVSAGAVEVVLPDLRSLPAVALVARARNEGSAPLELTFALPDREIGSARVAPGAHRRIDLSFAPGTPPGTLLRVLAPRGGWTLLYLEVGSVHGHSTGLFGFLIEPAAAPARGVLPLWAAPLALALLAAAIAWQPGSTGAAWDRRLGAGVRALALAAPAVALASPWLSPYRILLSRSLLLVCAALLLYPSWARLAVALVRWARTLPWRRLIQPAAALLLLAWVGTFCSHDTGFTSLLEVGTRFHRRATPALRAADVATVPGAGYDGQFYAQLALDPLLRDPATAEAMDRAGYRARRILPSWSAWLLGAGAPHRVLQIFALQNVACWLVLALLLARRLRRDATGLLCWSGCMFGQGLLASIRFSLLEGPSALLLTVAVLALERGWRRLALGVCALAGLVRETNLLWAATLWHRRTRPRRLLLGGVALVAPLAAWGTYLTLRGLGGDSGPGRNLGWPLAGYLGEWREILGGLWRGASGTGTAEVHLFGLLCLLGLTVQAFTLSALRRPDSPWWRGGIAFVVLALLLADPVWRGDPGAAPRLLLPMTLAFNLVLHDEQEMPRRRRLALLCAGNLTAVAGLAWLLQRLATMGWS